ncbi:transposable element Tcb1 transposase [Trichonephila clavipes]|nr:transposable element Tcb1 transposase [Trichonephila clavipes]
MMNFVSSHLRHLALEIINSIPDDYTDGRRISNQVGSGINIDKPKEKLSLEKRNPDFSKTRSVENKPRPGDPRKLTSRAKRMIVSVCSDRQKCTAQCWSESQRTPRKKPYISEVNRKRRLEFVMKYKNKPMDFWKKVIFSDESKFEIFTPPGIRKIGEKNKTALEPKNVLPTLKHGGGNVMVW